MPSGTSPSHLGLPEARPQWPRYGLTASWRLPHTSLSLLTLCKLSPYDLRLRYNMLPPLFSQHHRPYLFTKADSSGSEESVFIANPSFTLDGRCIPPLYFSACYVLLVF